MKEIYRCEVGIVWDKKTLRWVGDKNDVAVDNLFSLQQVETVFFLRMQHLNKDHDRALLFATTHSFNPGFGSAATRMLQNGKVAYCDAKMGSYNSRKEWYMSGPQNLGQVLHDGTRVSKEVYDDNRLDLHGSMFSSFLPCMELVITVDVDKEGIVDRRVWNDHL